MIMAQEKSETLSSLKAAIREALHHSDLKERRTIGKRFYVTSEEAEQLEALCQGVSLSAFVRAKVLDTAIPRPRIMVPQPCRELYTEIANLKASCNQMAKAIKLAAQKQQVLPLTPAYLEQLARLEALFVSIARQLRQGSQSTATDDVTNTLTDDVIDAAIEAAIAATDAATKAETHSK